jgi:hypothetical protein
MFASTGKANNIPTNRYDDYEEEIELSDEERKERLKKNPFYVNLSEEKEKEPKQEDKRQLQGSPNNGVRCNQDNIVKFPDGKGGWRTAGGRATTPPKTNR